MAPVPGGLQLAAASDGDEPSASVGDAEQRAGHRRLIDPPVAPVSRGDDRALVTDGDESPAGPGHAAQIDRRRGPLAHPVAGVAREQHCPARADRDPAPAAVDDAAQDLVSRAADTVKATGERAIQDRAEVSDRDDLGARGGELPQQRPGREWVPGRPRRGRHRTPRDPEAATGLHVIPSLLAITVEPCPLNSSEAPTRIPPHSSPLVPL